ncbi:MAG TPA: methyltransferase domain-containing protein [Pseudonocardiaceae bacterium]|jgi:protein-L-isoaspartate(D-aspartate) O-methyltransferase|nr:methyltransferase domain-containing protein [Pseudonocardiaceae bacterium]
MTARWPESMAAVPRRLFVPETIWQQTRSGLLPLHRAEDPDRWRELADGDGALITQVDDGQPAGPGRTGALATSSVSMPKLVAEMLDHLDVHQGHRVLEIGTGTGWNAALLAHQLGAAQVTSIEIDPEVAAHARKALSAAGFGDLAVITANGALGYPPHAPYDRVIATVAPRQVPYAWVTQTRPAGRIVTPIDLGWLGVLVTLTVAADGSARGYIFDHATFMPLRDQRGLRGFSSTDDEEHQARVTQTHIHPAEVANPYHSLGSIIAIAARVNQCRMAYYPRLELDDHDGILWLADHRSGSWARLHHNPDSDGPHPVYQYGPRTLWDEVAAAHTWWVDHGKPGADRWQVTITPRGQQIELLPRSGPPGQPRLS